MATKKTVIKLETEPVYFTIIGISSHENDYRLSWSLNEKLGLSFSHGDSLLAGSDKEFSRFFNQYDNQLLVLISNRCDNGFLIDKHKNLDFILKIDAQLTADEIDTWLRDLRKSPLVSAAFHIPVDNKITQLLG